MEYFYLIFIQATYIPVEYEQSYPINKIEMYILEKPVQETGLINENCIIIVEFCNEIKEYRLNEDCIIEIVKDKKPSIIHKETYLYFCEKFYIGSGASYKPIIQINNLENLVNYNAEIDNAPETKKINSDCSIV